MTQIISLIGGPGTGKSTTAARLFAKMKDEGKNVELVQEYVKQWAWEQRKPVDYDQFYFFGKQARKETSLFHKVDFIVTDAPVALTCYYAQVYGSPSQAALFRQMYLTYKSMCEEQGHTHHHVFLNRVKPYNTAGRFQTEEQARDIDVDMKRYLNELGLSGVAVDADATAADMILTKLFCGAAQ